MRAFGNLSGNAEQHRKRAWHNFDSVLPHLNAGIDALDAKDCATAYKELMVAQFYFGHVQANVLDMGSTELDAQLEALSQSFDKTDSKFLSACLSKGRNRKSALHGIRRRR